MVSGTHFSRRRDQRGPEIKDVKKSRMALVKLPGNEVRKNARDGGVDVACVADLLP